MRVEHDTISGVSSLRHPISEALVRAGVHSPPTAAEPSEVGPISYLRQRGVPEAQRELNRSASELLEQLHRDLAEYEHYRGVFVREVGELPSDCERYNGWDELERENDGHFHYLGRDGVGRIPNCAPARAHVITDTGWRERQRTSQPIYVAVVAVCTLGFWAGVIMGVAWLIA